MPALTLPVRHGQRLDYEGLRKEAAAAVEVSGKTQGEVAELCGVTQAAVSQALRNAGGRYEALQRSILRHVTEYEVEPAVITFRVQRKR